MANGLYNVYYSSIQVYSFLEGLMLTDSVIGFSYKTHNNLISCLTKFIHIILHSVLTDNIIFSINVNNIQQMPV